MGCGSHKDPTAALQQQQRQNQAALNQSLAGIDKAFMGFNEPFYNNVRNSYLQYQLPALQNQYQQAKDAMTYGLASRGLGQSSAAERAAAGLSSQQSAARSSLAGSATDAENAMRQQIAQEKAQLYGQAQNAQFPGQMVQQALTTAATTQAPSTFAPLGQMFGNIGTMWLANKQANLANQYANQYLGNLQPSFDSFNSFNYRR